mgnify:CR=1 FL=1
MLCVSPGVTPSCLSGHAADGWGAVPVFPAGFATRTDAYREGWCLIDLRVSGLADLVVAARRELWAASVGGSHNNTG